MQIWKSALFFQNSYVESIIKALEARFHDNDINLALKILNPSNMPSRRVGLASWGVTEFELLLKHYGVQKEVGGKILPPLVNFDACKREFFFISNCKVY